MSACVVDVPSAQRTAACERTSVTPPPRPPYAHAHAIAWRGSFIAHSCVNERLLLINEHVSTCRGSATETQHIQCGGGPVPPLRPPSCWPPPSWPAKRERMAELQSPARGPTPTQILGVRKCRKKSVRDYGRIECASQFGACDGAGVRVRGAKRDGDARWRACGAWGVQPTRAARRRPRRSPRACGT